MEIVLSCLHFGERPAFSFFSLTNQTIKTTQPVLALLQIPPIFSILLVWQPFRIGRSKNWNAWKMESKSRSSSPVLRVIPPIKHTHSKLVLALLLILRFSGTLQTEFLIKSSRKEEGGGGKWGKKEAGGWLTANSWRTHFPKSERKSWLEKATRMQPRFVVSKQIKGRN